MHSHLRAALAAAALLVPLAGASAASASTIVREGDVLVFRADPGVENHAAIGFDAAFTKQLEFRDRSESDIVADPSTGCTTSKTGFGRFANCPFDGIAEVRLETGDGDDELDIDWVDLPKHLRYVADGGPGDDDLEGLTNDWVPITMFGGEGDDVMEGGFGRETFDGGPGNDQIDGGENPDTIIGGPGDDQVTGGPDLATDTIDGGPGRDFSKNDWLEHDELNPPAITVSLDGKANDGRPGENDDVTGVEHIQVAVAATLIAGLEPVEFDVEKSQAPGSRLVGSPGRDALATYNFDDRIDGKGGRDTIFSGMGNDVIEARDGAKDVIDCSDGTDVARVDRIDVTANCERVRVSRRKKGRG